MLSNRLKKTITLTIAFTAVASLAIASQLSYKVAQGDTLYDIAKKHHVSVDSILSANKLTKDSVLQINQVLIIPNALPDRNGIVSNSSRKALVTVHVNKNNVCLRKEPSTSAERITLLPADTNCILLERTNNKWAKVKVGEYEGYVYRELLASGPANAKLVNDTTSQRSKALLGTALACRGSRYLRGGRSRAGFDCSGFTQYVFKQHGISLPRTSASQSKVGTPVSKNDLKPGDLVFFATRGKGVSHVGIYIGDGKMVHAATERSGVKTDSLSSSYYASRYHSARRVK